MRDILLAKMDKTRPVLVLTRDEVRAAMTRVTVAPITGTIKGLSTEVPVGARNGLEQDCVVSCDNLMTIRVDQLGRSVGLFFEDQERALSDAIGHAFALRG